MGNELVSYLKNVHKLEQNMYSLNCAQEDIKDQTSKEIRNLENENYKLNSEKESTVRWGRLIALQKAPEVSKRKVDIRERDYDYCYEKTIEKPAFWISLLFIGLIGALIYSYVTELFDYDDIESIIIWFVCSFVLFSVIAWLPYRLIFAAFLRIKERSDAMTEYYYECEKADLEYKNALAEQRRLNKQYEEDYDRQCKEHQAKISGFEKQIRDNNEMISRLKMYESKNIEDIESQKVDVQKVLDKIYSVGIIYPKYRSLIPISMFIEYFESGRCQTLKGHEGAYNIYESEVRQDTIISSLANISSKMNVLQERQYMLYSAINEANRISRDMARCALDSANSSRRAAENSEKTAQIAALAAQHTKTIADSTKRIAQIEADRLDELKRFIED